MYAFAERPDTQVVDEPLYAHYLSNTDSEAEHPGRESILASQENDGEKVIREQLLGPCNKPVVLFKQMTHHLIKVNRDFLEEMEHILLIRDPRLIIQSYTKVIPNPQMADLGIEMQYVLFRELQARGKPPVVIDANELLKNPEKILEELCNQLVIPWFPEMLSWEAGGREEDGVWAAWWYRNVHQSTGFQPYQERQAIVPTALEPLAKEAEKYYQFLFEHALKA
ncbi:MAG: hypothetical protein GYB31_14805 [Bacteroidetes bacterium]|nr:hypothetical protein [Bacteroidota bacterium]